MSQKELTFGSVVVHLSDMETSVIICVYKELCYPVEPDSDPLLDDAMQVRHHKHEMVSLLMSSRFSQTKGRLCT